MREPSPAARRLARAAVKLLPPGLNPAAIFRELPESFRWGFLAFGELIARADEYGPPDPPAELLELLEAAALEFRVPCALLAAVAWEFSAYDPAWAGAGRSGLLGLPAAAASSSAAQDARRAAHLIRSLELEGGLVHALEQYAGEARAHHVAGTFSLFAARQLGPEGRAAVRATIEVVVGA